MSGKNLDKPIYLAIFKLIKYLYLVIRNYPKEYKYTLGEDTLKLAWATLDCVMEVNSVSNREKEKSITEAITIFNRLKFRLRLASENKLLSHKSYAHILKQRKEIDKMLFGWLKWSEKI
jgi:hypothetical protein